MKNFILFCLFIFNITAYAIDLAITIDDLPVHGVLASGMTRTGITREMLNHFKSNRLESVYGFVNSAAVNPAHKDSDNYQALKLWVDEGHPLGNHTQFHDGLSEISAKAFIDEILNVENLIKSLSPNDYKVFRYPFLDEGESALKKKTIVDFLKQRNYQIAEVTIDFGDWGWNAVYARCLKKNDLAGIKWMEKSFLTIAVARLKRAEIISQKVFGRSMKQILLMHVGPFSARMMGQLIAAYKDAGVNFINLQDAMKDPAYAQDHGLTPSGGGIGFLDLWRIKKNIPLPTIEGTPYPEKQLASICK